ncbi:hypothetical protein [Polaromonas sp. C04]|uniref:hypothetical protein n=1 Tax=Polaromonas sp. C04 TaxID=1945857 RepID=UPI0009867DA9|nr:hypothetical protein [Polaromonas sp. C04]OOG58656.1 hypothetical protein B0E49_01715 [Polaromonas sp. C04]
MKQLLIASLVFVACSAALAKLPTPVLSDEAKAKALEAAAKTAWSSKVDGYLLCKSQDKVAADYFAAAKAAGKQVGPAVATPACTDPGPFAYTPPEATKPLEAAGAHSPPATAASPSSGKQPDATGNPAKKP